MIEVNHEVRIPAAPERVWEALVDFANYGKWSTYILVRGVAAKDGEIEWSLASTVLKRRLWTKGIVTDLCETEKLSWTFGTRGIFAGEETYSLERLSGGTRLQHTLRYRGLVAMFRRAHLKKSMGTIVATGDDNLQKYVSAKSAYLPPPARPSLPKGSGRNRVRRKRK